MMRVQAKDHPSIFWEICFGWTLIWGPFFSYIFWSLLRFPHQYWTNSLKQEEHQHWKTGLSTNVSASSLYFNLLNCKIKDRHSISDLNGGFGPNTAHRCAKPAIEFYHGKLWKQVTNFCIIFFNSRQFSIRDQLCMGKRKITLSGPKLLILYQSSSFSRSFWFKNLSNIE